MVKIVYKKEVEAGDSNEPQQEAIFVDELVGPFIDKISMTIPLPGHYQGETLKDVWSLENSLNPKENPDGKAGVEKQVAEEGIRRGPKGNYRFAFWLNGVGEDGAWSDEAMLFQVAPRNGKSAFYRMEWNPRLYCVDSLDRAKAILTTFMPNGWDHVIKHARITRLDVAIDLTKVHVDTLVLRGHRPQKFGLYTGRDGLIETIYVGDPKGSHIIAYDRMKRIKNKGKTEPLPLIGPVTRIESVKVNMKVPLKHILGQADPFKALQVFQFPTDKALPSLTTRWPTFRDMCQVRGFHRAMRTIPKNLRKKVRYYLPSLRPHWWDQDQIWKRWEHEVQKQGLLKTLM